MKSKLNEMRAKMYGTNAKLPSKNKLIITGGDYGSIGGDKLSKIAEFILDRLESKFSGLKMFDNQVLIASDTGAITFVIGLGQSDPMDSFAREIQQLCHSLLADSNILQKALNVSSKVKIGNCQQCSRELRVKGRGIKPKMNITCKCGSVNSIDVPNEVLRNI